MALIANNQTFRNLALPNLDTTYQSTMGRSIYSESVNSAWTHPNPLVEQIGNHLIHKDEMPHNLRFNDQKRDKEVLDNLRNRGFRGRFGDASPAINRQPVVCPSEGTPVPYSLTTTEGTVASTYGKVFAPTYNYASTLYPNTAISAATSLLAIPPKGKPYSPLATPVHGSGLPYSGAVVNPAYAAYHGFTNHTMSYGLDRTYTPLSSATYAPKSTAYAGTAVIPPTYTAPSFPAVSYPAAPSLATLPSGYSTAMSYTAPTYGASSSVSYPFSSPLSYPSTFPVTTLPTELTTVPAFTAVPPPAPPAEEANQLVVAPNSPPATVTTPSA